MIDDSEASSGGDSGQYALDDLFVGLCREGDVRYNDFGAVTLCNQVQGHLDRTVCVTRSENLVPGPKFLAVDYDIQGVSGTRQQHEAADITIQEPS